VIAYPERERRRIVGAALGVSLHCVQCKTVQQYLAAIPCSQHMTDALFALLQLFDVIICSLVLSYACGNATHA